MMQDNEMTQPAEPSSPPAQPAENTEPEPADLSATASATTETVVATPPTDLPVAVSTEKEAMPEQPSPSLPAEGTASVSSDLSAETLVKAEPEATTPHPSTPPTSPDQSGTLQIQNPSFDLSTLRQKANAERTARRGNSLSRILVFASTKKEFSNEDIRDLLHVSQSSVSSYLSELVKIGKLKRSGRARAARYSL